MFSRKDLVRLILPIVLEQILAGMVAIADVFMISYAGEVAVSGVSLITSINYLFTTMFSALATGGVIVCSQHLGRGDRKGASASARHIVIMALMLSIAVMVPCLFGYRAFLVKLYPLAEIDVLEAAAIYFLVTAFSYPFQALFSACSAVFRADGDTRTPLYLSFLMNAINIGLNALFIYVMQMGVLGVALASLIARAIASLILLFLLARRKSGISFRLFSKEKLQKPIVLTILRISLPIAGEGIIFQVAKVLLQGLVTTLGTVAIAANAVTWTISDMVQTPSYAIGLGMVTVVGYCAGAGDFDQAKRYIKHLMAISMGISVVLAIICYGFADNIATLYNLSFETSVLTGQIIRLQAIGVSLFWSLAFNLAGALQAAGDIKFVFWSSIICTWLLRVLGSYLLCAFTGLGLAGIWIAMFADWAVRSVLNLQRIHGNRWKNRQVLR